MYEHELFTNPVSTQVAANTAPLYNSSGFYQLMPMINRTFCYLRRALMRNCQLLPHMLMFPCSNAPSEFGKSYLSSHHPLSWVPIFLQFSCCLFDRVDLVNNGLSHCWTFWHCYSVMWSRYHRTPWPFSLPFSSCTILDVRILFVLFLMVFSSQTEGAYQAGGVRIRWLGLCFSILLQALLFFN